MKAVEIRLGNYLWIGEKIHTVSEIRENQIISTYCSNHIGEIDFPIYKAKSVFITMQWLSCLELNLRHETEDYTMHQFGDSDFDIIHDFDKLENKYSITFEGNPIAYIQYIHQLQNFHYLLTNNELELKAI